MCMGVRIIADGKVVIDVILEDGQVAKGVANVDKQLGGIGDAGKRASLGVGKIATALGLVYVAKKGIDMVTNSLGDAISRYDTLNQFPKVLETMGFDAKDSEKAIDNLSKGIDGLPTRLDEVASTAQNIAVMTGDLDGAVDTTLALNNAFLASGSGAEGAKRGMEQYVQMMATGKVDGQSWKTLQETMGVALSKVAEQFGFTGKAAKNDLFEALKSGEITMEDFNNQLIKVNEGQGGLAELAIENSKGVGTSWKNITTAVVNGVTKVIEAIDKALGGVGTLEGGLDRVKGVVGKVFTFIATQIPKVASFISKLKDKFQEIVEKAKEVWGALQPWMPLFVAIGAGIATFAALAGGVALVGLAITKAIAVFNMIKTVILGVRVAMITLNAAMMLNPFALIAAAIVAAAVLVYLYWEPISEFFIMIWHAIRDAGLEIWENLKEGWANAVENLKEAWESVIGFFSDLMDSILEIFTMWKERVIENWNTIFEAVKEVVSSAYEWINEKTNGMFGEYVEIIQSYLMTAWEIIQAIWTYIQDTFSNFMSFIKALVKGDFQGMKDAIKEQMETARELLFNIWTAIKTNIGEKMLEIWNNTKEKFQSIKQTITDKITEAKNAFVRKLAEMVVKAIQKAVEIYNNIRDKFNQVKQAIRDKITEAKEALVNKFIEMVSSVITKGAEIVTEVRDAFEKAKEGVKEKLTDAVTIVSDKIAEMPEIILGFATDMFDAGKNIASSVGEGIKDGISNVGSAMGDLASKARGFLPFSPAKEGPFKDIMDIKFGESIAKAIDKGKGTAADSMHGLADSVNAEMPGMDSIKGVTANSSIGSITHDKAISSGTVAISNSNNNLANIMKEQNQLLAGILNKDGNVYLDGDKITDRVNENNAIMSSLNRF